MVFSSPAFLFVFLPLVLALHFVSGARWRNPLLLVASLLFYAWGEPAIVLVMLASIAANYGFGMWLERSRASGPPGTGGRHVVALSVVFNLGLLGFFKYTNWIWNSASALFVGFGASPLPSIPAIQLPIGISFFTFQAMSYVIDVYRGQVRAQRSILDFGLYISFFPQLIAGPIVRYCDVARQLALRVVTADGFAHGVRRFTIGLAKKMLIANTLAWPAERIFSIPGDQLPMEVAWLGAICYGLQLYFDFSGYSDMAIGMAYMFGFRFLENFDYPYLAVTITDFWRRWHISLTTWMRDYVYRPLGGNRLGTVRTYFNLFTVFLLCGLWHGAAWNFVIFGLLHGVLMVLERLGLARMILALPPVLNRVYFVLVILISWVIFRGQDLGTSWAYMRSMFGFNPGAGPAHHVSLYLDAAVALALIAGAIGSVPWLPRVIEWHRALARSGTRVGLRRAVDLVGVGLVMGLLLLSAMELSADTYNPFIYFRF